MFEAVGDQPFEHFNSTESTELWTGYALYFSKVGTNCALSISDPSDERFWEVWLLRSELETFGRTPGTRTQILALMRRFP